VAGAYYDIGEIGDMHHNPAKNVLHCADASRAWRGEPDLAGGGEEAAGGSEKKLYAARLARPTPYVDKTIYVAWKRDVHLGAH